jgi:hypothetical protein
MSDFVEPSPVAITDGTNTVAIDGSGAMSVSVAGAIGGTVVVSGSVAVSNLPTTQPVSGSVAVSNLPTTQPVSGSVAVSNLPTTQPISGSVVVSNLPVTQPISGTVAVSGTTSTKQTFATTVASGAQAIVIGGNPLPISAAVQGFFLSAPSSNTAAIYIGSQFLVGNKGLQILAGQNVWFPLGNMTLLYAQSASGTQLLNYLVL